MGEYHDLYSQWDVLLLAYVMNKFRQTCMEHYKPDPSHFCTLPHFSWNVMLKMTNVNIELLRDIDMCNMISKNIRSGSSFILAKDANNLYGKAMTEPLPYGNVENCNPSHSTNG